MKKWEQGGFTTLSWSWSQKQTLIACPRCLYQPLPWAWLCQADLHKAFVNWTFYNYVKLTWNTALSPSYDHLSKNQCFWLDWSKFIICFEATPLADVVKKKKKTAQVWAQDRMLRRGRRRQQVLTTQTASLAEQCLYFLFVSWNKFVGITKAILPVSIQEVGMWERDFHSCISLKVIWYDITMAIHTCILPKTVSQPEVVWPQLSLFII